jgi:hypothetical protein
LLVSKQPAVCGLVVYTPQQIRKRIHWILRKSCRAFAMILELQMYCSLEH